MSRRTPYSTDQGINDMVHLLVEMGWVPVLGGRHWRLRTPCGRRTLTIPGSPSDNKARYNFRSDVRRACRMLDIQCPV